MSDRRQRSTHRPTPTAACCHCCTTTSTAVRCTTHQEHHRHNIWPSARPLHPQTAAPFPIFNQQTLPSVSCPRPAPPPRVHSQLPPTTASPWGHTYRGYESCDHHYVGLDVRQALLLKAAPHLLLQCTHLVQNVHHLRGIVILGGSSSSGSGSRGAALFSIKRRLW